MKYTLSVIGLILVLASCSPKLSPDSNWNDRRWILHEVNGVPVQLSGTNKDAHLNFIPRDKRYNGSGGCNRISGNYEIRQGRISFSEPTGTRMMCNDQAFEDNFISLLKRVDRYSIENDMMVLKDGNRVLLIFK
jgi:heat shock protein HslJ